MIYKIVLCPIVNRNLKSFAQHYSLLKIKVSVGPKYPSAKQKYLKIFWFLLPIVIKLSNFSDKSNLNLKLIIIFNIKLVILGKAIKM